MNLSHWNGYPPERQHKILFEISRSVRNRVMPLPRYLLLHPEAKLSDAEVDYLYRWAKSEQKRLETAAASANPSITGCSQ
jgi:hypothetical protein